MVLKCLYEPITASQRHYMIKLRKLNGEYIECDYYVFFRPFHNNKGNCAEIISVIESPERSK